MSEKTLPPTAKRLLKSRSEGDLPSNKEQVSVASFLVGVLLLFFFGVRIFDDLSALLRGALSFGDASAQVMNYQAFIYSVFSNTLINVMLLTSGAAILAFLVGCLLNKFSFSMHPLIPKLDKLNPAQGVKRLFSVDSLVDLLRSILKCIFLGVTLYHVVLGILPSILHIQQLNTLNILWVSSLSIGKLMLYAAAIYCAFAYVDHLLQHYRYIKKLRMSIDEVRREYKDNEGDPRMKGLRRQLQRSS